MTHLKKSHISAKGIAETFDVKCTTLLSMNDVVKEGDSLSILFAGSIYTFSQRRDTISNALGVVFFW